LSEEQDKIVVLGHLMAAELHVVILILVQVVVVLQM
jgi:hypothetical protein